VLCASTLSLPHSFLFLFPCAFWVATILVVVHGHSCCFVDPFPPYFCIVVPDLLLCFSVSGHCSAVVHVHSRLHLVLLNAIQSFNILIRSGAHDNECMIQSAQHCTASNLPALMVSCEKERDYRYNELSF
jgi:hypothetical protein